MNGDAMRLLKASLVLVLAMLVGCATYEEAAIIDRDKNSFLSSTRLNINFVPIFYNREAEIEIFMPVYCNGCVFGRYEAPLITVFDILTRG